LELVRCCWHPDPKTPTGCFLNSILPALPCRLLFWNMCKVLHLFYLEEDGYASPKVQGDDARGQRCAAACRAAE